MSSFDVEQNTIFLATHGSTAYGTNIETSDVDVKGICVPPVDYLLGYAYNFEQRERKNTDEVIYGVQKFFKLAADCNPNIIELLFVDPEHVQKVTPAGEAIRYDRDLFLSKKARFTFAGYAHAQLKRIYNHRKWLRDPPKAKPERKDFGLADNDAHKVGVIRALHENGYVLDEAERWLQKEKEYATALERWAQYRHWKTSRNEARAILEAKFGYDTKHAMHLVRLMRMCVEILDGKGVQVFRPDREELISIRRGAWSYEDLLQEAKDLDEKAAYLYEHSALRSRPSVERLNDLCIQVIDMHHDMLCF